MEKPTQIDPAKIIGFKGPSAESECHSRDAILYALGIGIRSPTADGDLKYLNQDLKNFSIFPTFATCLHNCDVLSPIADCPGIPKFNPLMILYAEHRLVINRPILPGMRLQTTSRVTNVQDKGKMTIFTVLFESKHEGFSIFSNEMSLIVRGMGGSSHKGEPGKIFKAGKPELVIEADTLPNQAIIYRLSGDRNPLHVDPNAAAIQNFQRPILHGLSTYGTVCKALVDKLLYGNSDFVKTYHARFVGHVFPGQTLLISVWKEPSGWGFSAKTKQRGKQVIVGVFEAQGIASSL